MICQKIASISFSGLHQPNDESVVLSLHCYSWQDG
jgi:hypothetical protein